MRNYYFLILFAFVASANHLKAQDSCLTAMPLCTGTAYDFDSPTSIAAPGGPNYGCLGTVANPTWFSIEIGAPGSMTITGNGLDFSATPAPIDIDYIFWGPYTSLSGVCYTGLDAAHIVVCDYSGSNLINITIPSALPGQFYIGMVSNYANVSGNIHIEQTGGTATTACGSGCSFSSLTALPTSCDSSDNTYSVSGTLVVYNVPSAGTLTVFGSCGGSQTFTAPFVSPINYTLSGMSSNGASCFVSAAFSNDSCSINKLYTAPAVCNSTAIQEFSFQEFSISPNPSNGIFELSFESAAPQMNLYITDILGKVIYTEIFSNSKGLIKKKIDISQFKKGLYFVRMISEAGSFSEKIISE
ncbi:hypothetical protein BH10BAC1_BH10BAC1_02860 [soil metagenome]